MIALHDPDDAWDVQIFSVTRQRQGPHHEMTVGEATGFTITGGGGSIDEFRDAVLTSCGFVTRENPVDGTMQVVDGFHVSSREWRAQQHRLTGFAIGVRPKNGSRLQLRAVHCTTAKAAHIEQSLGAGPGVIGGGVYSKDNVPNFLTGSCPDLQSDGKAVGWLGTAKDHYDPAHNALDLVALIPVNTKVTYEPMD